MSRNISRKVLITLTAAAALAAPLLGSSASYARGVGGGMHFTSHPGGGGGGSVRFARVSHIGHFHAVFPRHLHHPIRIGRLCVLGKPCLPHPPLPPIWVWHHHHHHHWHWVFRGGRWIEGEDVAAVDAAPMTPAVTPGPCTCLTKTYTPTGLVVFADICTKESASAPAIDDTADASQAPSTPVPARATPISEVPTTPNYAGKTYDDYMAANPQAKPEASVQGPAQN